MQEDEIPQSPLPGFDGVDFEDYVTMDDELVTCVEPDSKAIFNDILAATKHDVEATL